MRSYDEQVFRESARVPTTRDDTARVFDQITTSIRYIIFLLESASNEFLLDFFQSARGRKEDDVIERGCGWSAGHDACSCSRFVGFMSGVGRRSISHEHMRYHGRMDFFEYPSTQHSRFQRFNFIGTALLFLFMNALFSRPTQRR